VFVPGKPTPVKHLSGAPLYGRPLVPTNNRLGWKGLPGKNTSLLQKSVNYGNKKFYSTGPAYVKPWLFNFYLEDS